MIHKTLVLTSMFPPAIGGAERYLANLAKGLDHGRIIVVAPPHPEAKNFDDLQQYTILRRDLHRGPLRPSWLGHVLWLIRIMKREKITRLVFGHYGGFVGLGPLMKFITGTPYIVSIFGLDFTAYRRTAIRRFLLRVNLHGAEWITTISNFTRSLLLDFKIPAGKIILAPPGLNPNSMPVDPKSFRDHYQLGSKPILLTVGRLVKRKGHYRVLQALQEVVKKIPTLQYVIIGDGPTKNYLEDLVRQYKLQQNVLFLGRVADKVLNDSYAAATAFIMTTESGREDVEGFGIVYTEALQAGTPIIATAAGGVVDILEHNPGATRLQQNADAATIAAAIENIVLNTEKQKELGSSGKKFVEETFTLEKQITPFKFILAEPETSPKKAPTVSVVIPTYNAEATIARTLHSLEIQTWRNFEIIVVDDGSADGTRNILLHYPQVRVLSQAHRGAPAARNFGKKSAGGEFVLFCDADVILHPRMIERMIAALRLRPEASYAYCNFKFGWRTFDLFDFNARRLQQSNYISTMSLIRKSDCPEFDESIQRLQDWDLWLTMLEDGKVGTWIPDRLFVTPNSRRGLSGRIQAPPNEAIKRVKEKHSL